MTQNATQAKKSRSFTVGVSFRLSSYYSLACTPAFSAHSNLLYDVNKYASRTTICTSLTMAGHQQPPTEYQYLENLGVKKVYQRNMKDPVS